MYNRTISTTANSKFFYSLKTLISSIHKHSLNDIDQIFVYDLGLSKDELKEISGWAKCSILEYPDTINTKPESRAYKCYARWHAKKHSFSNLYLDAGVMLLKSVNNIFEIIDTEDIFLVGDKHLNKNYTHDECIRIMEATQEELEDTQLSSGIFGYKIGGKYQNMIEEGWIFGQNDQCVAGDSQDHRHDQSIYSILASRYGCNKYDIDIYGYWTDHNRNLATAIENGAVIFVHRNGHWDFDGLRGKHND